MQLNRIIQGDCLEVMRDFPDGSVDLVLTDPPYFLPAQHYNTRRQFRRNFSDLGILEHFYRSFYNQIDRILKQSGSYYIFCDGQSYPLFYYYGYFFSKALRPLIWDKMVSINGYGWRHQCELILWGTKPEAKPIPTGDGDIIKERAVKIDLRQHPAEKPVELIGKLIEKSTQPGDIICDPFIGSGTTAVACKELDRNYIGIELSPEYCAIAEKRIAAVHPRLEL